MKVNTMTTLSQIVAVEKGIKSATTRRVTDVYHALKKAPLFSGLSRTYQPRDDEGEQLPPERTRVQLHAEELLRDAASALTELMDVVLTKDIANTQATANVEVDGEVILTGVPVTYLLFMEKQLSDLHSLVQSVPTLDPSEAWTFDEATGLYRTEPTGTTRTKKIPRNHVKAEATDKHPAQVELFTEDVVVGYWNKTTFSGAVTPARMRQLVERVEKLHKAVKFAREQANSIEIRQIKQADRVFDYLLRP